MPISQFKNYPAPPVTIPFLSGRYFGSPIFTTLTTVVSVANTLYASPILIPTPTSFTSINVEVTAFVALSNVYLGVYYDSAGQPGALAFDAGAVDTASNVAKSIAIAQTLQPGWYWLAALFSHGPTMRAMSVTNALVFLGFTAANDVACHVGVSVAQAYGALPDPFTGGSALHVGSIPRVMLGM